MDTIERSIQYITQKPIAAFGTGVVILATGMILKNWFFKKDQGSPGVVIRQAVCMIHNFFRRNLYFAEVTLVL
jgi:hypothetical protein